MPINRSNPNTGQTVPDAIISTNTALKQLEDDRIADTAGLDARVGVLEGGRSGANPWRKIHTNSIRLGGVTRNSWPSASSGAFGQVVYGGSVTLNGTGGVTVTHNLNLTPTATAYIVIVQCSDISKVGLIGDIACSKTATSVLIKNCGNTNIPADIVIIDLNP
ncbi:MAG: hypothetical protein HW390_3594 [Candidatus Brocadiaceae bacterium]|nr:hypothetical protein [Candidatus Brocadiaceae bacterium]